MTEILERQLNTGNNTNTSSRMETVRQCICLCHKVNTTSGRREAAVTVGTRLGCLKLRECGE